MHPSCKVVLFFFVKSSFLSWQTLTMLKASNGIYISIGFTIWSKISVEDSSKRSNMIIYAEVATPAGE
jgi:hypothetical protein